MVDIKELRVGNLINPIVNNTIIIVESICDDPIGINIYPQGDRISCYYDKEDIKAIPLTKTLLKELGFKGREDFLWNGIVGIQIKENRFYLAIKDLSNVLFHSVVEVKSVHHLQNLYFFLTGEELTLLNS